MQSNPFCTRFIRPGAIAFLFPSDTDNAQMLSDIADRISREPATLIVGPHGTGKTTLLESLLPQLDSEFCDVKRILLHASDTSDRWNTFRHKRQIARQVELIQRDIGVGGLLIVDGLEQLNRVRRAQILKQARRHGHHVLATSHKRYADFTTVYETYVDPLIIAELTTSLLSQSECGLQRLVRDEICRRGPSTVVNVRDLWFDLYDVVANFQSEQCQKSSPGILSAGK